MKQQHTYFTILFCLCLALGLRAQTASIASVSNDSILLGNIFVLSIEVDGGKIEHLDLNLPATFELVSGPNISSSMTMINDDITRTSTYSYFIKPTTIGVDYVPSIIIETDQGILETLPIEVATYPNPDNVTQEINQHSQNESQFNFNFSDLFDNPMFEGFLNPTPEKEIQKEKPKRPLKRI